MGMDMDIMSVSNRRDGFNVKVRCAVMKTPPLGEPPRIFNVLRRVRFLQQEIVKRKVCGAF